MSPSTLATRACVTTSTYFCISAAKRGSSNSKAEEELLRPLDQKSHASFYSNRIAIINKLSARYPQPRSQKLLRPEFCASPVEEHAWILKNTCYDWGQENEEQAWSVQASERMASSATVRPGSGTVRLRSVTVRTGHRRSWVSMRIGPVQKARVSPQCIVANLALIK